LSQIRPPSSLAAYLAGDKIDQIARPDRLGDILGHTRHQPDRAVIYTRQHEDRRAQCTF
jgi:hypothetical protein